MGVIDYRAKIDAISNLLTAANTTTASYDLSTGLTKRVQKIIKGDPAQIPNQLNLYPCIFIQLETKTESLQSIGHSNYNLKRKADISWGIFAYVYHGSGSDDSDKEVQKLSENIEEIFRRNIKIATLSDMQWGVVNTTDFGAVLGDGIYLSAAKVNYTTTHLY